MEQRRQLREGQWKKALKLQHDVKNEGDKLQLCTNDQRGSRSITGTISQRDRSEMLQNCPSTELRWGEKETGLFDLVMELRRFFILYLTDSSIERNSHFKNTTLLQTQIKWYFIKNVLSKGVLCLFVFRLCFGFRLIRKCEEICKKSKGSSIFFSFLYLIS